jgi:15-cis-phytoene synthase
MMPRVMPDAFSHCAELVRNTDRDRFIATLFAPAQRRAGLHAVYAFSLEVARVRDLAREAMPGEIRLQWWREVLERQREGEASASPVAVALLGTIDAYRLPVNAFLTLIEARRFDLYNEPMLTIAQLEDYAIKTSSALFDMAAQILDAQVLDAQVLGAQVLGADAAAVARPAGIAYAMTGVLAALPKHAARRQLYLPLQLLERHGLGPEDIFAARSSAPLNAAAAELRSVARRHLDAAAEMLRNLPQQVLPAFLPMALVRRSLDRLERSDIFAPGVLSPWRRQWLMWRAARNLNRLAS